MRYDSAFSMQRPYQWIGCKALAVMQKESRVETGHKFLRFVQLGRCHTSDRESRLTGCAYLVVGLSAGCCPSELGNADRRMLFAARAASSSIGSSGLNWCTAPYMPSLHCCSIPLVKRVHARPTRLRGKNTTRTFDIQTASHVAAALRMLSCAVVMLSDPARRYNSEQFRCKTFSVVVTDSLLHTTSGSRKRLVTLNTRLVTLNSFHQGLFEMPKHVRHDRQCT